MCYSTGVGRTGTLITIQSMMKMIEREKKVDIFNFVLNMRHQRNLVVQTEVNTNRKAYTNAVVEDI